jgi:hypothetical protein
MSLSVPRANRVTEIRALHPGMIRLFVSEYYNLLPKAGTYHFNTLDSMVSSILQTGTKPLMANSNPGRFITGRWNKPGITE